MNRNNETRRAFFKQSGLAAAAMLFANSPVWARIFWNRTTGLLPPLHNIPADKKLDPRWVKSLYQRGQVTTYRKSKNELAFIGMPAGGLHAGTVYLGGDGRLWLWGIYNDEREGVDPKTVLWNDGTAERKIRNRDGANYIEPTIAANKRVLEQGFAIKILLQGKTIIKELKEEDWEDIQFEASYPVATIRYIDKNFPLEVVVQAGGLFIPLDAENSSLPATVYSITLINKGQQLVNAAVVGWFENGAHKVTARDGDGMRRNTAIRHEHYCGVFADFKATKEEAAAQRDAGSTCIIYVGNGGTVRTNAEPWPVDRSLFDQQDETTAEKLPSDKLVGSTAAAGVIGGGETMVANFVLSWHFNHPLSKTNKLAEARDGYYYGKRFRDAASVAAYIAPNFDSLHQQTLLWQHTFYDSTLPHWFLERTFLNIGTLATANTYRFANGRFWSWEGVNACEGTCTHVWQYAQAMGRIFPSLERDTRARTDLGIALQEDGGILFRAEYENRPAIDGQAGSILRIYREHQMSVDNRFLTANWPGIKKATVFMLTQDKNGDGMTDTPMENTLDAVWEGEVAWIVGLCIAAAKAAQLMADEVGDVAFSKVCATYVEKGCRHMGSELFNGEYFIHRPDPVSGRKKLGSYNTCHIDQVYGQSWAWQVGLGRLWEKEKTLSALRSLWKYNFTTDVGPYIKTHMGGRPYAVAGEGGMVMNTNPHNEPAPYGEDVTWQLGYFHECMSGFEHQVASHMMAEGMTDEAMVLTRAIHDRHHASKRNPFNEIECSDHYARAMASYGTFITACGFEYHGPKGYIRFAPRWNKEHFKAAFTAAEGWGSYSQSIKGNKQQCTIALKYGTLQLKSLSFERKGLPKTGLVSVTVGKKVLVARFTYLTDDIVVALETPVQLQAGEMLVVTVG
ncbi:GH116 family glycosyl hydrolase [Paraflavitalea sp. CAU 1676]|uniref:GH116 family glycosyl hydrolase n=1 Tax=Paraflavitalea sp. CAU 1676 TaxID=3032598 RepID=UPI0023DCDDCF|nr:GH116 family glycosyl hydrolase [Paraflavitalea sp. CAU 1676]MDF2191631.1 GH116 family glycosyl hydrolase [Paraflavitalea sp. CAU 1676]